VAGEKKRLIQSALFAVVNALYGQSRHTAVAAARRDAAMIILVILFISISGTYESIRYPDRE
jgi:hypothetical protein